MMGKISTRKAPGFYFSGATSNEDVPVNEPGTSVLLNLVFISATVLIDGSDVDFNGAISKTIVVITDAVAL